MPISTNLEVGEQLDEFQVVLPLGSGAMGAVYEVTSKRNPQVRGAMKVEPIDSEFPVAQMELSVLRRIQGRKHFCTLIGMGRALGLNYLVMSRLGPSLQDLRKTVRDSQFTHVTVALVALQCIEALRQLHSVGFIHRDVKPANFAIGLGEAHGIIHLLDFGICRTWWDSRRKPRAPRPRAPFRGTIRYASIATHEGMEQSRIDDLWSLFYMIVELVRGSLDWVRSWCHLSQML